MSLQILVVLLLSSAMAVDTSCLTNAGCDHGFYCCKMPYSAYSQCRSSCVGESCEVDDDCGEPQACCKRDICSLDCKAAKPHVAVKVGGGIGGCIICFAICFCIYSGCNNDD